MAEARAPGSGPVERSGLVRRLAHLAATLVYRDIDVHLPVGVIPDGPVLAVANHFGGLADGVLLVDSLPRTPRVVARDVIWRVPVVGRLASAAGMIPVSRPADRGAGSNDAMFGACYAALRCGDLVLIFPEGVTQDVPYMAPVRTGAARIALGARGSGVRGIHVLPVGLHYENKAGFRSRVLVNVGEPIDLDLWAAELAGGVRDGADDRDAVRDLTALLDERLRRAAPDFPDWTTAHALEAVAEVLLNDVDPASAAQMHYGDRALLAARLNRAPGPARDHLVDAGARYRAATRRHGSADRAVMDGAAHDAWWRGWLVDAALFVLLLPYAMLGLLVATLPLLLVAVVSRLPIAPAVRATAVPGLAVLAFVAAWLAVSWQSLRAGGWELGFLAVLLFPFTLAALFLVHERLTVLWRRWRSRRRPGSSDLAQLRAQRSEVSERGWAAL